MSKLTSKWWAWLGLANAVAYVSRWLEGWWRNRKLRKGLRTYHPLPKEPCVICGTWKPEKIEPGDVLPVCSNCNDRIRRELRECSPEGDAGAVDKAQGASPAPSGGVQPYHED